MPLIGVPSPRAFLEGRADHPSKSETCVVRAVVVDPWTYGPQVLLEKVRSTSYNSNLWGFPGGNLEPNEDPLQGIHREIGAEEIMGLDKKMSGEWRYQIIPSVKYSMRFPSIKETKDVITNQLAYLVLADSSQPLVPDPNEPKILEIRWFPMKEARRVLPFIEQLHVLENIVTQARNRGYINYRH